MVGLGHNVYNAQIKTDIETSAGGGVAPAVHPPSSPFFLVFEFVIFFPGSGVSFQRFLSFSFPQHSDVDPRSRNAGCGHTRGQVSLPHPPDLAKIVFLQEDAIISKPGGISVFLFFRGIKTLPHMSLSPFFCGVLCGNSIVHPAFVFEKEIKYFFCIPLNHEDFNRWIFVPLPLIPLPLVANLLFGGGGSVLQLRTSAFFERGGGVIYLMSVNSFFRGQGF